MVLAALFGAGPALAGDPPKCVENEEFTCEMVTHGHYAGMFGLDYGSGGARGFQVGLLPPSMRSGPGGGYSGFVLGAGDIKRKRVYFEYMPSFIVYAVSWYWGAGAGYEPERGPMVQATLAAGALVLLPYARVMLFPATKKAAGELGLSLKFGAIGDTSTESYRERVPR